MSTLPYQNETKTAELKLHVAYHLQFLTLIDGTVSHVLYGYCYIMLFTEEERPYL